MVTRSQGKGKQQKSQLGVGGELSAQAHTAGENTFTYGVMYGREEQRAAAAEAALPKLWRAVEAQSDV